MAKQQKMVITGIPVYDGEYDVGDSGFTTREFHYIKQVSGVRSGELEEAIAAGDAAVMVALTGIILQRAGKVVHLDLLWEAHDDCFDVRTVCPECQTLNDAMADVCATCGSGLELEDSDRPLATPTNGGQTREPAGVAKPSERSESSGGSGSSNGENNPPDPTPTGDRGSDESSDSDLETSAI